MNKLKKRALAADGALLLVAIIWGGGFVAGKMALDDVTPLYVLAIRVLGAGVLLGMIFWPKLKTVNRETVKVGTFMGALLILGQGLQMYGLQYTTAGKQAFLIASYALLIPFVSWLVYRKRPPLVAILAGVVMLVGIGFLSLTDELTVSFGDAISLLAAVFFAFHIVFIGKYAHSGDPIQLSIVQLLAAGALALVLAVLFEPPIVHLGGGSVMALAYLLLINTAVAFSIQNVAQGYTTATHSSIILSLESVFGLIFSIWLLGEMITSRMAVGVVLIFGAVILSKLEKEL